MNKKYKTPLAMMAVITSLLTFGLMNHAYAASLIGTDSEMTDTDGSVTGTIGATYYNTASWQDMVDTYKAAPANSTVYFNITGDVAGASVMGNSNNVISGKSLTLIGNDNMLYVDNNTTYTNGLDAQSGNAWGSTGTVSSDTTLTVQNARITNNITGGIFQMQGSNALATTVYKDVQVENGTNEVGAQPIRNDRGKILFHGENTFNILTAHSFSDNTNNGNDNNGEWIQGGTWFEVCDGTTTLNQSWGRDQPLYTYGNLSQTMQIDDNASLIWNLNDTYCMYWDDPSGRYPMYWNIGNNANFVVNGTANTASSDNWFASLSANSWTVNIGQNSKVSITTGGRSMNLDGFNGGNTIWTVGSGSEVLLNNLNSSNSIFTGTAGSGSSMTLNDPKAFTLNTVGGSVFANTVRNLPITITGNGLRTHASDTAYNFPIISTATPVVTPDIPELTSPNRTVLGTDIWYRQNTGTLTNIGQNTFSTALAPNPYSSTDQTAINNAKYVSWYQPIGYWNNSSLSAMDRIFNISLDPNGTNGVPFDGSWSSILPGTSGQKLVVGDDRGQDPNFTISIEALSTSYSKGLQFYWTDPTSGNSTPISSDMEAPIANVTSDSTLPSWIQMTGAGAFYTLNFSTSQGLTIEAKNNLLLANNANAGTFQYTIASGV